MCVCCHVQAERLADSVVLAAIADASVIARFGTVLTTEWLPGKAVGDCLYRGSVHGMTPGAFHARCDGKGPTLMLTRADKGGRVCVFGGYTSASWRSRVDEDGSPRDEWVPCGDAFLFSVVGPHCSVVQFPLKPGMERKAMASSADWGPRFGVSDLVLKSSGGKATDPFDWTSNCEYFGHREQGVYTDTVGMGPRTFTGTTDEYGRFTPTDVEVYAVV